MKFPENLESPECIQMMKDLCKKHDVSREDDPLIARTGQQGCFGTSVSFFTCVPSSC